MDQTGANVNPAGGALPLGLPTMTAIGVVNNELITALGIGRDPAMTILFNINPGKRLHFRYNNDEFSTWWPSSSGYVANNPA